MKYDVEVIHKLVVTIDTEDAWHYDLDDADVDDPESIAAEMALFDAEDAPTIQYEEAQSVSIRVGSVTLVDK